MRQLYLQVLQQLKTQRESTSAQELWETVWKAYQEDGSDGVAALVEKLATYPVSEDNEAEL